MGRIHNMAVALAIFIAGISVGKVTPGNAEWLLLLLPTAIFIIASAIYESTGLD